MIKTFKYRIYPSKSQRVSIDLILSSCCWLYNKLLEQRKSLWENKKKSISLFKQNKEIKKFSKQNKDLSLVHSQVLQNVSARIDLAFKAFFRRCKKGEKPGYPRFRGRGWYNSFTYPQNNGAFKIVGDKITLSKIGLVKIKHHRRLGGIPKTCTVLRTSSGKYFVSISCEMKQERLKKSSLEVGIDVGLSTFATFSDEKRVENPRFFKQEEKKLARAQRRLTKQEKGTNKRCKKKKIVSKIYERIANKRRDFCHKEAKRIVEKYGVICFEDLSINKMIVDGKKKKLSKSIADASWGLFLTLLFFKAENAGRKAVKVNPAFTTQDCSNCGNRQVMKLSDRQYECPACGLNIDRDLNASRNILSVGLHTLSAAQAAS